MERLHPPSTTITSSSVKVSTVSQDNFICDQHFNLQIHFKDPVELVENTSCYFSFNQTNHVLKNRFLLYVDQTIQDLKDWSSRHWLIIYNNINFFWRTPCEVQPSDCRRSFQVQSSVGLCEWFPAWRSRMWRWPADRQYQRPGAQQLASSSPQTVCSLIRWSQTCPQTQPDESGGATWTGSAAVWRFVHQRAALPRVPCRRFTSCIHRQHQSVGAFVRHSCVCERGCRWFSEPLRVSSNQKESWEAPSFIHSFVGWVSFDPWDAEAGRGAVIGWEGRRSC